MKNIKKDIKEIKSDSCVIIKDYKENIKIGGGPIETNNCFYEKTSSILKFVLVFKENDTININIMIFKPNFIS